VAISKVFSSPEIERLRDMAIKAGAQALKICGPGAGVAFSYGLLLIRRAKWRNDVRKPDSRC